MFGNSAVRNLALEEALEDFFLSRRAKGCSPATLEYYKYSAGMFVAYLKRQSVDRPGDVISMHVRQFLVDVAARGVADTTVHAVARGTRALLRFWQEEGYRTSPIVVPMPHVDRKRLPFLAPEQVRNALGQCSSRRDRALLLFLVDTGVRRAEALAINWGEIDFDRGAVAVARGKGGKARTVVIGDRTTRALLAYRRSLPRSPSNEDPLWQSRSGRRLALAGLRALMTRLSRRAGIRITPHMLRRTFALMALRQGMDLISLQRLMGHADLNMTSRYVAMLDEDLVAAHNRHGLDTWL